MNQEEIKVLISKLEKNAAKFTKFLTHKDADTRRNAESRLTYLKDNIKRWTKYLR